MSYRIITYMTSVAKSKCFYFGIVLATGTLLAISRYHHLERSMEEVYLLIFYYVVVK